MTEVVHYLDVIPSTDLAQFHGTVFGLYRLFHSFQYFKDKFQFFLPVYH
jgi:hypothetical protein